MSRATRYLLATFIVALATTLLVGCKSSSKKPAATSTRAAVTAGPTSTPVSHAADIEAHVAEYAAAVAAADEAYQVAHLHRTALNHFGEQTCRDWFAGLSPDPTFAIDVQSIAGPAPWTWAVYGETIATIPDVYTLHVTITQGGASQEADVHFQWNAEAAEIRGFSPCVPRPNAGGTGDSI